MQKLPHHSTGRSSADLCARGLLASVPGIMRFIRHQMRQNRQVELTVPQLRALVFLSHGDDGSLSAMAEHLGLSLPAASRMVDLLVRRGLMGRRDQPNDRRRVSLSLTRRGRSAFEAALTSTRRAMARTLKSLSREELAQVLVAMQILNRVFEPKSRQAESAR